MALCTLILIMLFTSSLRCAAHFHLYYPDLTLEIGTSCWEKTLFATLKDPFYNWITRSYLVSGFENDKAVSIQEAGSAYKRLSVWRVTNSSGTATMLNAPEPHILGGKFRYKPEDKFLKMILNWGLSVRLCLGNLIDGYKGENMCLYTAQVIAVKKSNKISFRLLLVEEKYNGGSDEVTHLTNWVSNAMIHEAVGMNRIMEQKDKDSWYYLNKRFEKRCKRPKVIAYRPDMVAYVAGSYAECRCIGYTCIAGWSITINGEFHKQDCKEVDSYWLIRNGVYLYTYISKWDRYFALNTTFNSSAFDFHVSNLNLVEMESLSTCLQNWLNDQSEAPDPNEETLDAIKLKCKSMLIGNAVLLSKDAIILFATNTVWQNVEKAVENGDDCNPPEEANSNDNICISNTLTAEQKKNLELVLANFSQVHEVRNYAGNQWKNMDSDRLGVYLGLVTSVLTALAATTPLLSKTWSRTENFAITYILQRRESEIISEKWILTRISIRASVLLFMIGQCLYSFFSNLKTLKSGPDPAWTYTFEHQPAKDMAFLITTTSTIKIMPDYTVFWGLSSFMAVYAVLVLYLIIRRVKGKAQNSPLFDAQMHRSFPGEPHQKITPSP